LIARNAVESGRSAMAHFRVETRLPLTVQFASCRSIAAANAVMPAKLG
jgi:hypothetical protein